MPWTEDFVVDHTNLTITVKDSSHGSNSASACTAAFAEVINEAIDKDIFIKIHKQHSEPFPILGAKYPVQLERFAADLFGITARGAHLTVYTIDDDKMKIWVPRRSLSLFTYPGKLDSTVAGGVCAGETPKQNIIREAQEEASLPADRVQRNIRAAGVLTYISYEEESLRTKGDENNTPSGTEASIVPDVIYVYDLEVGADVKPVPEDGEVKEFYLMGVEEVKDALARNEFKTNSAVVMIDFFVRHGIITEENEKDYVEIVMRMHRRLPFPTAN
jgi:8-oxo-dGTP pyrophosphatase MutT (NUDIX family)